jgi:NADH dehydrogenase
LNVRTVAVAGGSGFIGGTIARYLARSGLHVRVITRNVRRTAPMFDGMEGVEFFHANVLRPETLDEVLDDVDAIVDAVQFDGYPIENPRRGLTFERVDLGGVLSLLEAAKPAKVRKFVYISGASADEASSHPAFRTKARAERAIRDSGIDYTIFRPSLVYGPGDRVVGMFARLLKISPLFVVPGDGQQKLQPLLVSDLAQCVALALEGRGANRIFEIGGTDTLTFDQFIKLLMEITGSKRPLVHVPEKLLRLGGLLGEKMPRPLFSRDAVEFLTADNVCDNAPLLAEFGFPLTPPQAGMSYLSPD